MILILTETIFIDVLFKLELNREFEPLYSLGFGLLYLKDENKDLLSDRFVELEPVPWKMEVRLVDALNEESCLLLVKLANLSKIY